MCTKNPFFDLQLLATASRTIRKKTSRFCHIWNTTSLVIEKRSQYKIVPISIGCSPKNSLNMSCLDFYENRFHSITLIYGLDSIRDADSFFFRFMQLRRRNIDTLLYGWYYPLLKVILLLSLLIQNVEDNYDFQFHSKKATFLFFNVR